MSTKAKTKASSVPTIGSKRSNILTPKAKSVPAKAPTAANTNGFEQLLLQHQQNLALIADMHRTDIRRVTRRISRTVAYRHQIARNLQLMLSPTIETDQEIYDRYADIIRTYYERRRLDVQEKLTVLENLIRDKPNAFRLQDRDDVIEGHTMIFPNSYIMRDIPELIDLYQELCQYIDDIALRTFQETQRYHKRQVLLTMLLIEKQQSRSKLTQSMKVYQHTNA